MANGGGDTINPIKQAGEFGIVAGGQNLAALVMFISDIHSLGLKTAQGLIITEGYYWDQDDRPARGRQALLRAHATDADDEPGRDLQRHAALPEGRAGRRHQDTKPVMAKMREMPVRDAFTHNGVLREDGRMVHSMFLLRSRSRRDEIPVGLLQGARGSPRR